MNGQSKKILNSIKIGVVSYIPTGERISYDYRSKTFRVDGETKTEKEVEKLLDTLCFWRTENGEIVEIRKMGTAHMQNTINHLQGKILPTLSEGPEKREMEVTLNNMKSELRERVIDDVLEENRDDMGFNFDYE